MGFAGIAGYGNEAAFGGNHNFRRHNKIFGSFRRNSGDGFFFIFAVVAAQPAFALAHAGFQFGGKAGTDAACRFVFRLRFQPAFELRQRGRIVVAAFASQRGKRACFFHQLVEVC